jgi:hypothetical protein
VVRSHVDKIMEKAIMLKMGASTATHIFRLLTQIQPGMGNKRKIHAVLIELQKANYTVKREKYCSIHDRRCRKETVGILAQLIGKMNQ